MPERSRILTNFLISLWLIIINISTVIIAGDSCGALNCDTINTDKIPKKVSLISSDLWNLNLTLKEQLINRNYSLGRITAEEIIRKLGTANQDSGVIADSYYYVGVYYRSVEDFDRSIQFLGQSISLKERLLIFDDIYAKALYNIGGVYSRLGVFKKHKEYTLKSLEVEKQLYGTENSALIGTYASLITAYIELKDYEKALDLAEIAYKIADNNPKSADPYFLAYLYHNIGVLYNSIGDYSKSKVLCEKAEEYYIKAGKTSEEGYINLMNSMANALRNLGYEEKSNEYYKKGIELAKENYSLSSYYLLSNYAINMGNMGKVSEGESVFSDLLLQTKARERIDSQNYYEVLGYYADYLREFNIDKERSLDYYEKCIEYFDKHGDSFLKYLVKEGYAILLSEKGEYEKSLKILHSLLFSESSDRNGKNILLNPDIDKINPDRDFLGVLRTKYRILKEFYKNVPDLKTLEAGANTAELIISLLEKIRINISEEESRLLLGDRYRDSYLDVIRDFYLLYNSTSNNIYLSKAFEYTEKSKIAGLLAAIRELKATQFHIPPELAELERDLQQESAILNDRIAGKTGNGNSSDEIVNIWKRNLFNTIRKRDSLINVFEKEYPDYYSIKYNNRVLNPDEISDIIGKKSNYISYVASDTTIFISVINKRYQKLIAISVDSSFYAKVRKFRSLLSVPRFDNARNELMDYNTIGYDLYNTLITPIKPYLISERVVISPDNLLSYLPYETLPVNPVNIEKLSYSHIDYLMEELDISYTYSATFMAENIKRDYRPGNMAIVFAPDYSEPVDINSLFQRRQQTGSILSELPFAKHEAEYVSELLGGKLLLNDSATESLYKREAGNYDIIHLAMHTVLDDNDPMYSTLIFSPENSGDEDRFLRTFEIYGVPLKARMVVLSSCNTGTGRLYSGEGILSLARGFIYSGSESVVMSMWEIDDRTGTEIVKLYYDNLKKGYSKSVSLRKARIEFLKTADQLRAHPYFWSTLVIYGDNSPLFRKRWIIPYVIISIVLIFSLLAYYYLRKRRYS